MLEPGKIILGTVQFGLPYGINNASGQPSEEEVFELLDLAYRAGIRKLDTADAYGTAQDIISRFHRTRDIRFAVNTKFKISKGIPVTDGFSELLSKLSIPRIQVYFYHSFEDYLSFPSVLDELLLLKSRNLIQSIGLSVYTNSQFETAIHDTAIDVIQLPFNLLDNASKRGALLNEAKKKGKMIQVRSVFLQGLFFKELSVLPVYLLPLRPYLEQLTAITNGTGITMESLCLQYVNEQPAIDEMIIGVDNKEQLSRNMHFLAEDLAPLQKKLIDTIDVHETELLYPYNWK